MGTDGWRRAEKSRDKFYLAAVLFGFIAIVTFVLTLILAIVLDFDATPLTVIPVGSAAIAGVSYLIGILIRVRVPPEELERRAQASRAAALPGQVASYQSIMSTEADQITDIEAHLRARSWAKEWAKDLDARLALAKSANTPRFTLTRLISDDSLEVRQAALETLGSPQFKARQAEKARAEAERANLEAQRRRDEEFKRLANAERIAEQRRLVEARSTDTAKGYLRHLATYDPSAEVRRAAIETLALLRQAGF